MIIHKGHFEFLREILLLNEINIHCFVITCCLVVLTSTIVDRCIALKNISD